MAKPKVHYPREGGGTMCGTRGGMGEDVTCRSCLRFAGKPVPARAQPDPLAVLVRLSGAGSGALAGRLADMAGWYLLDRSEQGQRVCLTMRQGYPPVSRLHAWLSANGWAARPGGAAGALWSKDGGEVGVPHDDADPGFTRGALARIAGAEGIPLGELMTLVHQAKETDDA